MQRTTYIVLSLSFVKLHSSCLIQSSKYEKHTQPYSNLIPVSYLHIQVLTDPSQKFCKAKLFTTPPLPSINDLAL